VFATHTLPELLVRAVERILKRVAEAADMSQAEMVVRDPRLSGDKNYVAVAPAPHMMAFLCEPEGEAAGSAVAGSVLVDGCSRNSSGATSCSESSSVGDNAFAMGAWPETAPSSGSRLGSGSSGVVGVDSYSDADAAAIAALLPVSIDTYEAFLQPPPKLAVPDKSRESLRAKRKVVSDMYDYGQGIPGSSGMWRHLSRKRVKGGPEEQLQYHAQLQYQAQAHALAQAQVQAAAQAHAQAQAQALALAQAQALAHAHALFPTEEADAPAAAAGAAADASTGHWLAQAAM